MNRPSRKAMQWAGVLAISVIVGACGEIDSGTSLDAESASSDGSWIEVSGAARFQSGAPVSHEGLSYTLSVRASAPDGKKCEFGTAESALNVGTDGAFVITATRASLEESAAPGCQSVELSEDTLQSVRVIAKAPASDRHCAEFCDTSELSDCVRSCQSDVKYLQAERVFGRGDLSVDGDTLVFRGDLVFDELGSRPNPDDGRDPEPSPTSSPTPSPRPSPTPTPTPSPSPSPTPSPRPSPSPDPGLPDLLMDREAARQSVHITRQFFSEDSCAMAERCVSGTGERRLLRFDGVIWNVGESDFFLGDPRESDQFEYASCHGHYHLQDIAEYMLLDPGSGETLVVGRKQGFCMLDSQRINSDQPPRYNCDFQGLSAGWADVYESTLDCQWLDITDVPPGEYVMRIRVNPSGTFEESDYSNNAAEFPVSIP